MTKMTSEPDVMRIGGPGGVFVQRARLLDELSASNAAPVTLMVGAAGFGKTTLASQWLGTDPRPTAWINVSREHDDWTVLLTDIVHALDEVGPLDAATKKRLSGVSLDFSAVLVPRLQRAVAERERPYVLVFDDAHRLRRRESRALVRALGESIPDGSTLLLIARTEPDIGLGRLRASRRVHTVAGSAFAFDPAEAAAMFECAGLALPSSMVDRIWERTEGWPVGLYLATLALMDSEDPASAAEAFAGDDRLVVDYVRDELLKVLPRRVREFLLSTSVIDELTAQACDFLLKEDDSAALLADAARGCQLVTPLDRNGTSYRVHQLLRDTLRAELRQRHPERKRELLQRASDWYESQGDFDRAVDRSQRAGDLERAEALIWRATPLFAGINRIATVDRWLDHYSRDQITASPALTTARAWCSLTAGDMPSLRYWEKLASAFPDDLHLPDGTPAASAAALLRAVVGTYGIESMRADAALAYDLAPPASPYRCMARYLEGSALLILGRRDEARDRLQEGEAIGAQLVPAAQANCLAQLAALALEEGDPDSADHYISEYVRLAETFQLSERPAQAVSFAIASLVHARFGDQVHARVEAKHAMYLVSMLSTVAPWIHIETRIFLARTFLLLGDVGQARALTCEGIDQLSLIPDASSLRTQLAEIEVATAADHVPVGVQAVPLTPAELRVLRYLPTHLTFAAIADELFVSRNTVKTHAISVYRKLGVSSRDPAVAMARSLGMLES